MSEFYNPYHFIPVNDPIGKTTPYEEIKKGVHPYARHDKWQHGAKSGVIHCQVTLETPTVVGNVHGDDDSTVSKNAKKNQNTDKDKKEVFVHQYKSPKLNQAAIPANSLRGMIASIAEALSQSAMRVLNDDAYSVRQDVTEVISAIGMVEKGPNNTWFLRPLSRPQQARGHHWNEGFKHIQNSDSHSLSIQRYSLLNGKQVIKQPSFQGQNNRAFYYVPKSIAKIEAGTSVLSEDQFEQLKDEVGFDATSYRRYALYALSAPKSDLPPKKDKEQLVPFTEAHEHPDNLVPVPEEVIKELDKTFASRIARQTSKEKWQKPYLPTGYQLSKEQRNDADNKRGYRELQSGDLIHFDLDKNGQVCRLSYSAIWRTATQKTIVESFAQISKDLTPWGSDGRTGLTPAELLFGVVESKKADKDSSTRNLAGRVRFSDAVKTGSVAQDDLITLPKLAAPKPPSPAFYFNNAPQIKSDFAKQTYTQPKGRMKFYLPHKVNRHDLDSTQPPQWQTTLPQTNYSDFEKNRDLHMQAKPLSAGQIFHFEVRFDNLSEAELGLLVCALKPSPAFIHRLGLGKPLGLGQVSIEINKVDLIDRLQRYRSFDKTAQRISQTWQTDHTITTTANTGPEKTLPLLPRDGGLVDESTLAVMQFLGDPANQQTQTPVCYPFSQNPSKHIKATQTPYSEEELFKWFTENYDHRTYQMQALQDFNHGTYQAQKPGYANWFKADTLADSLSGMTLEPLSSKHMPKR